MSSVHGVLAAKDLLTAAGMYEQATEVLQAYNMWDELVQFAKEHKVSNMVDILEKAAENKKKKSDLRGCAMLYAELAFELFKQSGRDVSS